MDSPSKTLTVTEAKKHLLELIEDIEKMNERVTLTKNGIPTTIMMSLGDYEALIETLEILSDPNILKSLKKSKRQVTQNKLLGDDEVWG
ncbi:MAG: type II toxin-antitoxin system Phd/YefM family antitoxin [Deltaproteobacteria bacterium]|nr:type II toxin-antitoxin system Phd/YefM family antitoxin [Deltaproteobacteria bacterium]